MAGQVGMVLGRRLDRCPRRIHSGVKVCGIARRLVPGQERRCEVGQVGRTLGSADRGHDQGTPARGHSLLQIGRIVGQLRSSAQN